MHEQPFQVSRHGAIAIMNPARNTPYVVARGPIEDLPTLSAPSYAIILPGAKARCPSYG